MLSLIEASFFFSVCFQSSGKLDMERGMVKPMIRGEQQDSRSDMVSSNTLDSLDPHPYPYSPSVCVSSPHGLNLSHQVSGYFSRQNRADSSSQHRVQRQL